MIYEDGRRDFRCHISDKNAIQKKTDVYGQTQARVVCTYNQSVTKKKVDAKRCRYSGIARKALTLTSSERLQTKVKRTTTITHGRRRGRKRSNRTAKTWTIFYTKTSSPSSMGSFARWRHHRDPPAAIFLRFPKQKTTACGLLQSSPRGRCEWHDLELPSLEELVQYISFGLRQP